MKAYFIFAAFSVALLAPATAAQFAGPSVEGQTSTVVQINDAPIGSYVTVTGSIVSHQREDYYTFRDSTGEIRVEIPPSVWQGRRVTPEMRVRLLAEVDQGVVSRYLWVKSLEILK
jgi:uncharacterized protein (TIGR00156 family)